MNTKMKNLLPFLLILLYAAGCKNPEIKNEKSKNDLDNEIMYDSALARQLGADDYGMKSYVMAFLKRGPNRSKDSATAARLQRAHLDNIVRMAEEGSLVMAGPFLDKGDIRGIYIFDVRTIEEAEELTATDPAIKAGSLVMELHPWYGSAALPMLNDIYKKITKKEI